MTSLMTSIVVTYFVLLSLHLNHLLPDLVMRRIYWNIPLEYHIVTNYFLNSIFPYSHY